MYVIALFEGENEYEGLERSKRYVLRIHQWNGFGANVVEVTDTYPRVKIKYNSLHAFFRNWSVVGRLH